MLLPGLVSVSFRASCPGRSSLVRQGGLAGIEWGGDVHVPHGDLCAGSARPYGGRRGLAVAAYGSYYRIGHSEHDGLSFARAGDSPRARSAPRARVGGAAWFSRSRRGVPASGRRRVRAHRGSGRRRRGSRRLRVPRGTLTDTAARAACWRSGPPHLRTLWQPPPAATSPRARPDCGRYCRGSPTCTLSLAGPCAPTAGRRVRGMA